MKEQEIKINLESSLEEKAKKLGLDFLNFKVEVSENYYTTSFDYSRSSINGDYIARFSYNTTTKKAEVLFCFTGNSIGRVGRSFIYTRKINFLRFLKESKKYLLGAMQSYQNQIEEYRNWEKNRWARRG